MVDHFNPGNSSRRLLRVATLLLAIGLITGCAKESNLAEVTGVVTVDGEIPADGASISFIPQDGKSPSAGDTLKKGAYLCLVPIGASKVEIRVPRPRRKPKTINKEGPGSGPSGDWIEESLPPEFNAKTTLTFTVNSGKNEKNWDLQTKKK